MSLARFDYAHSYTKAGVIVESTDSTLRITVPRSAERQCLLLVGGGTVVLIVVLIALLKRKDADALWTIFGVSGFWSAVIALVYWRLRQPQLIFIDGLSARFDGVHMEMREHQPSPVIRLRIVPRSAIYRSYYQSGSLFIQAHHEDAIEMRLNLDDNAGEDVAKLIYAWLDLSPDAEHLLVR